MLISYFGHSSIGIKANGKNIIIDPFISANPLAEKIKVDELEADFVLLTHAHYDHILDVEGIVKRTQAKIISNHEVVTYYEKMGFTVHGMNQGGSWDFEFGRLTAVNAIHSSSFPDGSYGGNPIGFILESEGKTVYLAGDTGLTMDMKLIPMFHKVDLAILPIGGNFTMDVKRAIVAADFVECNKIMGVHYDTSPLIKIDHEAAKKQFSDKGKKLILMDIGAQMSL